MLNTEPCPCCSGSSYSNCCQPLHAGDSAANNAEQLMRSRYSAFCLGDSLYLIDTLHPDYRAEGDEAALKRAIQQTHWQGLRVIQHTPGVDTATVEYIAFHGGQLIEQLHELSRFARQEGRWFYTDGDYLAAIKLNRNEACFCGSARKYKKCHGKSL